MLSVVFVSNRNEPLLGVREGGDFLCVSAHVDLLLELPQPMGDGEVRVVGVDP